MFGQITKGTRLGRYELVERLTRGGMAEIWLAQDRRSPGDSQPAAVKTILPHLAADADILALFRAEAQLAASLRHPNLVRVLELGEQEDVPFIAMEYIDGRTLRQIHQALRKQHKAVPPWLVLMVGVAACRALDYSHELRDDEGSLMGIIHRDVTPENIMVSFSGVTKVVDFGVARAGQEAGPAQPGLSGKLAYLAPEQIIDPTESKVDRRVDVYAMGVLLYEMLTGVQPLQATNDMALLLKVPREMPRPPSTIARWLPTRLNNAIMTTLAKDPSYRYQTMLALARELEGCQELLGQRRTTAHLSDFLCELFDGEARAQPEPAARERRAPPTPLTSSPSTEASGVLIRAIYDTTPPPMKKDEDEDGESSPKASESS